MREFFVVEQWEEYEGGTKQYFFDFDKAVKEYSRLGSGPTTGVDLLRFYEEDELVREQLIVSKHNKRQTFSVLKKYYESISGV